MVVLFKFKTPKDVIVNPEIHLCRGLLTQIWIFLKNIHNLTLLKNVDYFNYKTFV